MLGVSILQEFDGVPDRQAVEIFRDHAGWNFALNRQLPNGVFHPTTLVNFRNRLEEHQQSALAFKIVWQALEEAGLVCRQNRQRLDSTQMFGRVARMSRLDLPDLVAFVCKLHLPRHLALQWFAGLTGIAATQHGVLETPP